MNGMQAMATVHDRDRMLVMRTHRQQSERVLVAVEDVGIGVKPENPDQLFNALVAWTCRHTDGKAAQ
jgi:hypothetical protein